MLRTLVFVYFVLALSTLVIAAAGADLYKVLGVKRTATDQEIKKACKLHSHPHPHA